MSQAAPENRAASPKKRAGGVVVPHEARWHQHLAGWSVFLLLQLVNATLRYRVRDLSGLLGEKRELGNGLYCIWHNRLAISMHIWNHYIKSTPQSRLAAMVSASKDGGFLSVILRCFQVQPVRGSSSRRGAQALREMTTWARRDYELALTPDGPRGPRYTVQDGVIALAQLTGRPIIPVGAKVYWKICLKSWDRFQIPLPFSRVDLCFGAPITVPRECAEPERERYRLQLENNLRELSVD